MSNLPDKIRHKFSVLLLLFLLLSISLTVYLARQYREYRDLRSQAASPPEITSNYPLLSYKIDKVLGQPDDKETMLNRIVPHRGFHLGGVHIDDRGTIYVVDSGNNRILGFKNYVGPDQDADLVIGQASLTEKGAANGDNTRDATPSASSLALLQYPWVITPMESARFPQLATDSEHNLYVPDLNNNRILKYIDPVYSDNIADEVWGQSDFTSDKSTCGSGGEIINASTLCLEFSADDNRLWQANILAAGVDIDNSGNLWVTDSGNNRVLRFPPGAKTADLVLGQSDFSSYETAHGWDRPLNRMFKPNAVRVKSTSGEVYVNEGEFVGQNRILVFSPPFYNGQPASRVIGLAQFQDEQPPDTTNWERIDADGVYKWVNLPSGLNYSRGLSFDKSGLGDIWVNDGLNNRVVLFGIDGKIIEFIGQPSSDTRQCDGITGVGYIQYDGRFGNICDNFGEIGIDGAGNLYISKLYYPRDISRFSLPLNRNNQGLPVSDRALLHDPTGLIWNQVSGKTLFNNFGLALSNNTSPPQLLAADGTRILVWNNYQQAVTFQKADYAVGQDSPDYNYHFSGGLFDGRSIGAIHASGGYLFATTDSEIYIFQLPINSSGKNYPTVKVLKSNNNVNWADNNQTVTFNAFKGIYYDAGNDALWLSDASGNRVLRINKPLSEAKVDLVLGQPDKSSLNDNAGQGATPVAYGFTNPWSIILDNYGNLYVLDSAYESGPNRRVLRFNASDVNPAKYGGNIFPLPSASGVYAKLDFNTDATAGPDSPQTPSSVSFDSQNRLLLLTDSYGNKQFRRAFIYGSNHANLKAPEPEFVLPIPLGQGSGAYFDGDDNHIIIQDYTWNRILFVDISQNQPTPTITSTPTPTPIPSPTATLTPSPTPVTSDQLLLNPGFELDANRDGKPDNWTTNKNFTRSVGRIHSGSFAGRHFANNNAGYSISQTVKNIAGNTNYSFSAWTNIPETNDSFTYKIQLIWKNASGNNLRTDTVKTFNSNTGGWKQTLATVVSPANAVSVIVRMNVASLNAYVFADDFSLRKESP